MAIVSAPQEQFNPIQSGLSVNSASRVGQSVAAIGQVRSEEGNQLAQTAKQMSQLSQQYFEQAQGATRTAMYSGAFNKASVELEKAIKDRHNKQLDDNGNPTFMSMEKDIDDIGKKVFDDIDKDIPDQEVKVKFKRSFETLLASKQIESMPVARKQQEDYVISKLVESEGVLSDIASRGSPIDAQMNKGEYITQVKSLVQTGALTHQQAALEIGRFIDKVGENRARALIQQDPVAMMEALAPESDGSVLKENQAEVSEETRRRLYDVAERSVEHLNRVKQATEKAKIDSIKELYTETNKIIERGGIPDTRSIQAMREAAAGTSFAANVAELEDKADRVGYFTGLSASERSAVLRAMESKGELTDAYETYKKIDSNLQEAQKKDVYSFAISQGLINAPQPLDINGDIAGQLASRRQSVAMVAGHYGRKTSGLSEDERSALSDKLNSLPPKDRAKLTSEIVKGMGSNSINLFTEMATKGARTDALVGVLVLQGREDTAANVLAGMDILKSEKINIAPSDKEQMKEFMKKNTNITNPDYAQDTFNMAEAIYAKKSAAAGDYSGKINADRYNEALQEALGGKAVEVLDPGIFSSGSKVVTPKPSMNANQFDSWLKALTDKDIEMSGGWAGWNSGMAEQLKKGKLEQWGPGVYRVLVPSELSPSGFTPIADKSTGRPFLLDYNKIEDSRYSTDPNDRKLKEADSFNGPGTKGLVSPNKPVERLDKILDRLTKGQFSASPRKLEKVENVIAQSASTYKVDPDLIKAVISIESAGNPNAESNKGAKGLMQLMPKTAKEMGVKDINDPQQNVQGGTKYLSQLLGQYDGNMELALAAYNAGPGAVSKHGGIPPYKETREYVKKVMAKYNNLKK